MPRLALPAHLPAHLRHISSGPAEGQIQWTCAPDCRGALGHQITSFDQIEVLANFATHIELEHHVKVR
jgi:hypothetical protein